MSVDDDCNKGCDNSSTLVAFVDGGCRDASKSSGDSGGCNLCAFADLLRVFLFYFATSICMMSCANTFQCSDFSK